MIFSLDNFASVINPDNSIVVSDRDYISDSLIGSSKGALVKMAMDLVIIACGTLAQDHVKQVDAYHEGQHDILAHTAKQQRLPIVRLSF